jgi:tetratricopeptide (TPR) repeat protein
MAISADIAGRQRDAIPEYRAALAAFRAIAPDSVHAVTVEENLVQALINVGEYAEAKPLQDHAVEQLQARHGGQHPIAAAARVSQAQILRTLGNANEARAILEGALPALEQAGPDYRGRRGLARYTLARCLADMHTDSTAASAACVALAAVDLGGDTEDPTSQRALAELQAWSETASARAPRAR